MIAIKFEAIRTSKFDDKAWRSALFFTMSDFGKRVVKEFDQVASFWHSNRPRFKATLNTGTKGSSFIEVTVSTDNPVFFYVDRGVPGHPIFPRKAQISGTAGTYLPGSLPGTLSVDPGGGTKVLDGNYLNLNQVIDWPGIEGRNWSGQIAEKLEKEYNLHDLLQAALNKVANNVWSENG